MPPHSGGDPTEVLPHGVTSGPQTCPGDEKPYGLSGCWRLVSSRGPRGPLAGSPRAQGAGTRGVVAVSDAGVGDTSP